MKSNQIASHHIKSNQIKSSIVYTYTILMLILILILMLMLILNSKSSPSHHQVVRILSFNNSEKTLKSRFCCSNRIVFVETK